MVDTLENSNTGNISIISVEISAVLQFKLLKTEILYSPFTKSSIV